MFTASVKIDMGGPQPKKEIVVESMPDAKAVEITLLSQAAPRVALDAGEARAVAVLLLTAADDAEKRGGR